MSQIGWPMRECANVLLLVSQGYNKSKYTYVYSLLFYSLLKKNSNQKSKIKIRGPPNLSQGGKVERLKG